MKAANWWFRILMIASLVGLMILSATPCAFGQTGRPDVKFGVQIHPGGSMGPWWASWDGWSPGYPAPPLITEIGANEPFDVQFYEYNFSDSSYSYQSLMFVVSSSACPMLHYDFYDGVVSPFDGREIYPLFTMYAPSLSQTTTCDINISLDGVTVASTSLIVDKYKYEPDATADAETGNGDKNCDKCAGSPINLSNGNVYIRQTDIQLLGLGGGLLLSRIWNSKWPVSQDGTNGLFGNNWRSTYEERIVASDAFMKYARSDGSYWTFQYDEASSSWVIAAPANEKVKLVAGDKYWTLTYGNGETRIFDNSTGVLVAIKDRNGNTTTLSYDTLGQLIKVTDPASRYLSFAYSPKYYHRISGVTSNFGISLSYLYDQFGRLTQVTGPKPGKTKWAFDYGDRDMITTVRDADGKILEQHMYDDQNRGVTSERANGVDKVTVTYPPSN